MHQLFLHCQNLVNDTNAKECAMQGGAISYAAAVATAFGVKACIVTAASSDANLTVFEGHELYIVSTQDTLTFEHTYTWWGEPPFTDQACRCHGTKLWTSHALITQTAVAAFLR